MSDGYNFEVFRRPIPRGHRSPPDPDRGARIAELRREYGLSYAAIAEELGTTVNTVTVTLWRYDRRRILDAEPADTRPVVDLPGGYR